MASRSYIVRLLLRCCVAVSCRLTWIQISEALVTEKSCFLESHSWQNIQVVDINSRFIPTNSLFYHEGLNHFAQVPGLLQKVKKVSGNKGVDNCKASALRLFASELRAKMLDWYIRAGIETRRFLQNPPRSEHGQTCSIHYTDSITASFAVNYYAFLILVSTLR